MKSRTALLWSALLTLVGPAQAATPPTAYDQCVAFPQAAGFRWSPSIIAAFCADWHLQPIDYAEIQELLDKGQGRQLDSRFDQIVAGYFGGTIAEGSARQAYMANFDYSGDETAAIIERWLKQSPGSAHALAARGIHHVRRASEARGPKAYDQIPRDDIARMEREVELGTKDLAKALLINAKLMAAYEALLHGARINNEEALGRTALKGALQADPKNYYVRAEYMHWLQPRWGGSLEAMSQFAKDAERGLKRNPRLAALNTQALAEHAWFTRGNDSREDLPIYENALLAAPFMPALTSAAYDAGKLGKHQRSVDLYSQVLRFWPNSVYELTQRGSAYVDLGSYDLARADLDRALAGSPEDASALRQYAHLHEKLNDNDKAIEVLLRARKADAEDTWTLQRLAWLYVYKKRDPKSAEPLVNELIKLSPRNGAAWLLRADVIQNLKLTGLRQAAENFVRYADTTDDEQRQALPKVKAWLAKNPEG